jgi:hypothetical protein
MGWKESSEEADRLSLRAQELRSQALEEWAEEHEDRDVEEVISAASLRLLRSVR